MDITKQIRFVENEVARAQCEARCPDADVWEIEDRIDGLKAVAETLGHFFTLQKAFTPLARPLFDSLNVKVVTNEAGE